MRNFGPNLDEARVFGRMHPGEVSGKLLSYNCSPSFNWSAKLDMCDIAHFRRNWRRWVYKFQFVTLAGFDR